MVELRICTNCQVEKSIDNFGIRKNGKHYWQCFACKSTAAIEWGRVNWLVNIARGAKTRAKKKGLEFSLSPTTLISNMPVSCPCCGIKLKMGRPNGRGATNRPSLDRVDSSKGYTNNNTRIICTRCNKIKNCGDLFDHERIVSWLGAGAPQIVPDGFSDGDGI
jgi:hypothetical protein